MNLPRVAQTYRWFSTTSRPNPSFKFPAGATTPPLPVQSRILGLKSSSLAHQDTFAIDSQHLPKFYGDNSKIHQPIEEILSKQRVLFVTNSFNSMAQRAFTALTDTYNMDIRVEIAIDEQQIASSVKRHNPDIIIAPFLTKRIPEMIWANKERPCLIVHPGIHGDRGASSIDWALKEASLHWGVTVLQADEEMDAGDIWATKNFKVPEGTTKSQLYGSSVVDTAIQCLHEALHKIAKGEKGIPLDYSDPAVKGRLRPNMKQTDRIFDFNSAAPDVARAIRYSDSAPGAACEIHGHKVFAYNAHVGNEGSNTINAKPGTITGQLDNGAIRIACLEGSVWLTHLKGRGKDSTLPNIKLPATAVLPHDVLSSVPKIPTPNLFSDPSVGPYSDLWATIDGNGVAILNYPFLNGAMSTDQCHRLTVAFKETAALDDVKVIVLAGGPSAWSNGINLNTIEASADPAHESWLNINAINDFVKAVFSETSKITVAALQGNAGAGGAMAALACDFVWAHGNIVLNPHYKTMGLHGSEYWTYFLPQRVGPEIAADLTEKCMPLSASKALSIGMIDDILTEGREGFMELVAARGALITQDSMLVEAIVTTKTATRNSKWHAKLQEAREHELTVMRGNFVSLDYIRARQSFVHKINPTSTPLHLARRPYDPASNAQTLPLAITIDGKKVANQITTELKATIEKIKQASDGEVPCLAVLMVGDRGDSEKYVAKKLKFAEKVGIHSDIHRYDVIPDLSVLEQQLIDRIHQLNHDSTVHGIIIQLPLPIGINKELVLGSVDPVKDVDGFIATSLGRLAGGVSQSRGQHNVTPNYIPCTARGIMALLEYYNVPLVGQKVCVVGRSSIVGMPTTLLMMQRGATVTNCDINTSNLKEKVGRADIVVVAAGKAELVKADWLKPGAVVIDVGVNIVEEEATGQERIVGDVESAAKHVASMLTPVPGGVGPMTVAMLIKNTVEAFVHQKGVK